MAGLRPAEVQERLGHLAGWSLAPDGMIERKLSFKDFREAMAFVNEVAEAAERANHHPDILVSYAKVTLRLISHDVKALSERDFALAGRINRLA